MIIFSAFKLNLCFGYHFEFNSSHVILVSARLKYLVSDGLKFPVAVAADTHQVVDRVVMRDLHGNDMVRVELRLLAAHDTPESVSLVYLMTDVVPSVGIQVLPLFFLLLALLHHLLQIRRDGSGL